MIILGIESSCDETSAALVQDGKKILSNVVFSQEKLHRAFKGIVPEIASRSHVEKINALIEEALSKKLENAIDGIAVTVGPGLVGSLLVGKMTAEALSWVWGKPLIGINHLEAHLFAGALEHPDLRPPFLGLVVSGGHTDLVQVEDYGRYKILGRTRDDAAGECFDKAANILGLGYPGGPAIDKLARKGDPKSVPFPRPYLTGSWDFSFSGLKTAVLYYVKGRKPRSANGKSPSVADVCASFQSSVVDVLVRKTLDAAKHCRLKKIAVGGGVSANSELRRRFILEGRKNGLEVFLPSRELCTDNAAMVASLGAFRLTELLRSQRPFPSTEVNPSLPILNWE